MTTIEAAGGPAQAQVQAEMSPSVLNHPAFTIARLEGDLDIATTPVMRERLLSVLRPGVRLLIIDLSGVSFCDVSALGVLIGTQRRARRLGIAVRLAALRPQMAKLMRLTGLDRHFTICAAVDDALPVQTDRPRTSTPAPEPALCALNKDGRGTRTTVQAAGRRLACSRQPTFENGGAKTLSTPRTTRSAS